LLIRLGDQTRNMSLIRQIIFRSAALFHMCYYELCIADIRRAISNGYDEKLLYKLLLRQTRCLQLLGKKFEDNLKKVFKANIQDTYICNVELIFYNMNVCRLLMKTANQLLSLS